MMKRDTLYIIIVLALAVLSCSKQGEDLKVQIKGFELDFTTNVEDSNLSDLTKAELLNSGSSIPGDSLRLYAWEGTTKWIDGAKATYSSSKWTIPGSYSMGKDYDYTYLAYTNMPSSGASITMPTDKDGKIIFSVTDISAAQNDVLIGKGSKTQPISDGNVSIAFSHPYSSVKFVLGNADGVKKVTGVSLTGVYESGSTTYRTSSTASSGITNYTWDVPTTAGATISATGLNVTSGDIASFVVIPQTLSTKQAVITVTYINNSDQTKTMTKLLNTGSWKAGYTTTYAIDRIGTITVTVSADGKTITNTGSSKAYVRAIITGAWHESSDANAPVAAPWAITEGVFDGLFPSASWTAGTDGYYYLTNALDAGSNATTFTSYAKPAKPSGLGESAELRLDVIVQAIPYNTNKTCQEAFAAL